MDITKELDEVVAKHGVYPVESTIVRGMKELDRRTKPATKAISAKYRTVNQNPPATYYVDESGWAHEESSDASSYCEKYPHVHAILDGVSLGELERVEEPPAPAQPRTPNPLPASEMNDAEGEIPRTPATSQQSQGLEEAASFYQSWKPGLSLTYDDHLKMMNAYVEHQLGQSTSQTIRLYADAKTKPLHLEIERLARELTQARANNALLMDKVQKLTIDQPAKVEEKKEPEKPVKQFCMVGMSVHCYLPGCPNCSGDSLLQQLFQIGFRKNFNSFMEEGGALLAAHDAEVERRGVVKGVEQAWRIANEVWRVNQRSEHADAMAMVVNAVGVLLAKVKADGGK